MENRVDKASYRNKKGIVKKLRTFFLGKKYFTNMGGVALLENM